MGTPETAAAGTGETAKVSAVCLREEFHLCREWFSVLEKLVDRRTDHTLAARDFGEEEAKCGDRKYTPVGSDFQNTINSSTGVGTMTTPYRHKLHTRTLLGGYPLP